MLTKIVVSIHLFMFLFGSLIASPIEWLSGDQTLSSELERALASAL